jgi:hypothetical protein
MVVKFRNIDSYTKPINLRNLKHSAKFQEAIEKPKVFYQMEKSKIE